MACRAGGDAARPAAGASGTTRIGNFPWGAVAIGLVLLIQASPVVTGLPLEQAGVVADMVNIVLLSVFINELIGPPLSKYAIIRGNGMEDLR